MKHLLHISLTIILAILACACIEDGYSTSPSDRPAFSTDTLDLGVVFTDEPTPTSRLVVRNPHSKSILISDISLSGADASCFRLNVDGLSGERFSDVTIRAKDSIFVLVEATLPAAPGTGADYEASLDLTTNGARSSVVIAARGQNVRRLRALTLDSDTRFTAEMPYVVYDSLVVAPGASLSLEAGTTLCFHDGAMMVVRGTLQADGSVEKPVTMAGDRTGNVVGDISFDIMSRQWTGLFFTESSTNNRLSHTNIRNTAQGVTIVGSPDVDYGATPQLTLLNCRLRNSGGLALETYHSSVKAVGCEFAEASEGLVYLQGGKHDFNHCTFANYYLFTVISGAAVQFAHLSADAETGLDDGSGYPYTEARFSNSIIYGLGQDLSHGDFSGTAVTFERCMFKCKGEDDENFINSVWETDPLYYTVRDEYLFDYRLREGSPAVGAADPALTLPEAATDGYGLPRGDVPDLGAYVYTAPKAE